MICWVLLFQSWFIGCILGLIFCWLGSFENYRLHSKKDEDEKNLVSKGTVVKGVLLQQTIKAIVAILLFKVSVLKNCFFFGLL
jgi:hypothetical protein